MAPSDDGIHVYVHLPDSGSIRRVNLATHKTDFEFSAALSPAGPRVAWMAVAPGDPDLLVVSYANGASKGVAAYVQGIQLPNTIIGNYGCDGFVFTGTADTLWCTDTSVDNPPIWKLQLDSAGLQADGGRFGLAYGIDQVPAYFNGRLYFNSLGRVTDPEAKVIVGHYPWVGTPTGRLVVDGHANRVYFSR